MKFKQFSQLFSLLIISLIIIPVSSIHEIGRELTWLSEQDDYFERRASFKLNQQVTASITSIVNLPIIEQHALTATPLPPSGQPPPETDIEVKTGTPTQTQIPVQTGQVNIPIVFGALGIILVIILAWFIIGYLPAKSKK